MCLEVVWRRKRFRELVVFRYMWSFGREEKLLRVRL